MFPGSNMAYAISSYKSYISAVRTLQSLVLCTGCEVMPRQWMDLSKYVDQLLEQSSFYLKIKWFNIKGIINVLHILAILFCELYVRIQVRNNIIDKRSSTYLLLQHTILIIWYDLALWDAPCQSYIRVTHRALSIYNHPMLQLFSKY